MNQLQIEYVDVEDLHPYQWNIKKHESLDVEKIRLSIQKYGFLDPIGIWGDKNIIVEGHGRLIASKQLGYTEVPCIRLDHLTDKQRREYAIAHNKTAEYSEYDFDNLRYELDNIDLSDFNFDFDFPKEIEAMEEKEVKIKDDVFQIIIDCNDEIELEEKYAQLQEMGIECRVSTL